MVRKLYNLTEAARQIKVHRLTLYYWIKKQWISPRRDYRGYPIFTKVDVKKIIRWRNKID